ncbi:MULTISPECIES: pentapeptide repeat-containing protein [unclassified Nostoc]|uniref:pentapeptide repeat-containing protein n=1 Tax=unclassified Nostoc TaxID=2593658 RepID=UPI002AD2693A|nr:pentapeptide repeat-containing protein [Nostoc sp. DedQUE03]MDZ7976893.1 pentapeptide repeat-containing protein [Nostoc sp. DedQUE03]MDZ8043360.1 pentapeptide repeat-containing protein [Nostoc sp. DedQUE02]
MANLNYTNQNLQNCSFKGQDLAGADFSGSDLRGCNFTGATLIGANFQNIKTGQSYRQVNILVAATIVCPVLLIGFSTIAVQVSTILFSDRSDKIFNFFFGAMPLLALIFEIFIQDSITSNFPQVTAFLGIGAITILFAVMVSFTVGLAIVSTSGFSDGSSGQGFFLLLLMVIFAIVTFRIFKWLIQSIQSNPGTSFKKANLTDADFSHSEVQNTDFSLAVLTGACVFDWAIKPHTQLTNVYCKYLYLEAAYQNRQPAKGDFQPGELERVLTRFMIR